MAKNVLEYLENSERRFPEKTAYMDSRGGITFGEFGDRARRLGSFLAQKPLKGKAVAVFMGKSTDMIAGFMGAVYAGCFYCPVDITMPEERIRTIFSVLRPAAVLVREADRERAESLVAGASYETWTVTYEEAVDCKDKNIHIRGISRDDCILKYSGLDYFNPPLEMATGTLENLTIIAENSGTPGAISGAYCLHADFDTQTNGTLVITNVHFINEVTTAVGIATRPHFCALLVNCTIEARGDGPALFTHDWEFTPEESGNGTTSGSAQDVTGQGLDLRNCSLTNTAITSPVIVMDSQELAPGCAVIRFQNDTVKNLSGGAGIGLMRYSGRALGVMGYLGGSDWVLAPDSSGNSDPQMNAATYSAPAQIAPSTGIVAPSDELLEEAAENVKNRYASDGTEDENDSRTNR